MATKKTETSKRGTKKLKFKKEAIKDLDLQNRGKHVKGGCPSGSRLARLPQ